MLDQLLQPVVTVDDATIQVVEIGRGKASAVERHERPQVGRDHRHDVHDHPGRVIRRLAVVARAQECVDDLQPLQHLLLAVLRRLDGNRRAQFLGERLDVDALEQLAHRRRTDLGAERVVPGVARLDAQREIFVLIEQLLFLDFLLARLEHDIARVVDHALEFLERDVDQVTHRATAAS